MSDRPRGRVPGAISVLLALVLAPSALGGQDVGHRAGAAGAASLDARIAGFRTDLAVLKERLGIPGLSVAVARQGELLWAGGLGHADVASARPATPETPYRIASITKTMTAAVVVASARDGELDLDDVVAEHLRDAPRWAEGVTIREVLTHTSESEPPGVGFAYSGRYDLLARVAEHATGVPFPELLVDRVLDPSGMDRSYPVALASSSRADGVREELATPYLAGGAAAPPGTLPDHTVGGNGVVSTVLDLVRWVHALGSGVLAAGEVREQLWTTAVTPRGDTLPYGLGWWVERTPALELVYHGGQWPVYSGLLLHVPGAGLTLAILANHAGVSRPFYGIGTGTSLYSSFAASFLRHFALDEAWTGGPPELPWDAPADSLFAIVERQPVEAARHHLGAELFGRGLVARAAGNGSRSDSLLRLAVTRCPSALAASEDLGILFHLGRSGDPELREKGQRAGRRRLARQPGDPVARFHLAVSYVQSGEGAEAETLLRELTHGDLDVPAWMWSWSAYLLAEQMADARPAEARALVERVLEDGVDVDGLFDRARTLRESLRS